MPQNTRLVLNKAQVSSDIGSIVLAERSAASFPRYVEHTAVLNEASEPPIALFFGESMVGRMVDFQAGVVRVPEHERKLNAAAPVIGDLISFKAMFEINRALINIIPMWE